VPSSSASINTGRFGAVWLREYRVVEQRVVELRAVVGDLLAESVHEGGFEPERRVRRHFG
jgi:hypothetical protein